MSLPFGSGPPLALHLSIPTDGSPDVQYQHLMETIQRLQGMALSDRPSFIPVACSYISGFLHCTPVQTIAPATHCSGDGGTASASYIYTTHRTAYHSATWWPALWAGWSTVPHRPAARHRACTATVAPALCTTHCTAFYLPLPHASAGSTPACIPSYTAPTHGYAGHHVVVILNF